jgi:hypothetical protein
MITKKLHELWSCNLPYTCGVIHSIVIQSKQLIFNYYATPL